MTPGQLYAFLVREHGLSYPEIAELTDAQIGDLLRKEGESADAGQGESLPLQEVFRRTWSARGMDHEAIKARWNSKYPSKPWREPGEPRPKPERAKPGARRAPKPQPKPKRPRGK